MLRLLSIPPVVLLGALLPSTVQAQVGPYAGFEQRSIKALSSEEVAGYLEGKGMSLALAAELNGLPGPRHVIDHADELSLTPSQLAEVQIVFDDMQQAAVALGREFVAAEQRLDSLFSSGLVTPESLEQSVEASGALLAQLRYVHLAAHIETAALMEQSQIDRYQHLRGYHQGGAADGSAAGHH